MRGRLVAVVLALSGGVGAFLYCQSQSDFNSIVDFSVNLKELDLIRAEGRFNELDLSKFLLLNGTLSDSSPKGAWFFLLKEEDLISPSAFMLRIRDSKDSVSLYLKAKLKDETLKLLDELERGGEETGAALEKILADINSVLKRESLVEVFGVYRLDEGLREIISLAPVGEELAYLNRLLMESAYHDLINPIQIVCELVAGEWIGMEEVKSYHCLILVSGAESFKVFNRRRVNEASSAMIPTNKKVLAVVTPLSPVTTDLGREMWLSEALYIRHIK